MVFDHSILFVITKNDVDICPRLTPEKRVSFFASVENTQSYEIRKNKYRGLFSLGPAKVSDLKTLSCGGLTLGVPELQEPYFSPMLKYPGSELHPFIRNCIRFLRLPASLIFTCILHRLILKFSAGPFHNVPIEYNQSF
jgi:hypothetical protein